MIDDSRHATIQRSRCPTPMNMLVWRGNPTLPTSNTNNVHAPALCLNQLVVNHTVVQNNVIVEKYNNIIPTILVQRPVIHNWQTLLVVVLNDNIHLMLSRHCYLEQGLDRQRNRTYMFLCRHHEQKPTRRIGMFRACYWKLHHVMPPSLRTNLQPL